MFFWPLLAIQAGMKLCLAKPDKNNWGKGKYAIAARLFAVSIAGVVLVSCFWQGYWPQWRWHDLDLFIFWVIWFVLMTYYTMRCIDGACMIKNSGLMKIMYGREEEDIF